MGHVCTKSASITCAMLIPLAAGALFGVGGCDRASRDPAASSGGTAAAQKQIISPVPEGPATVLKEAETLIDVTARMPRGFNLNIVSELKYTEDRPAKLISGRQIIKGEAGFIKSRELRMDEVFQPNGTKIIQIDVSADGPLPLPTAPSADPNVHIPGPILEDTIGNTYNPIGYFLENQSAGQEAIEINVDPGNPILDLRDLPALSKNKKQRLLLVFRVNAGVTLQSFSYGGNGKLTFKIDVPR